MAAVEPTHWSFGQLASWIKAPGEYLRRIPKQLACDCINHGIGQTAGERGALKFMAISRDDSPVNMLQAVTSTTYGRIWDADCVAAVQRLVERSNGRFFNPKAYTPMGEKPQGLYASDRDVFMFLIDGGSRLEVGPRAKLNRGFFCWNSEVGARTFGLTTFLFNEVCGNHIVWGASEVKTLLIRHTSGGPGRFDSEAIGILNSYVNASAAPLENSIRKAQNMLIAPTNTTGDDLLKSVREFADNHGKFTGSEIKSAIDFAKAEEGDCRTLWHLVQGLTAYARGFDWIDSRVDLETRAGKLLDIVS